MLLFCSGLCFKIIFIHSSLQLKTDPDLIQKNNNNVHVAVHEQSKAADEVGGAQTAQNKLWSLTTAKVGSHQYICTERILCDFSNFTITTPKK